LACVCACVIIAAMIGGCVGVDDSTVEAVSQIPIVSTVEPSPEPVITVPPAEPTPTAEPAETLLPTSFPEHPHYLELEIANNPVLSSASTYPACQLPCWYGLRPGESPIKQVDTVFDEVFQFGGKIHLVDVLSEGLPLSSADTPGTSYVSLLWQMDETQEETGAFIIDAVFDEALILQGIEIWQNSEGAYATESAQQIIQALGRPEHIRLDGSKVGYERAGYLYIQLVYTRGVELFIIYVQDPLTIDPLSYAPLCFTAPPEMSYTYLVPAFSAIDPEAMTIVQREWIGHSFSEDSGLRPVDEVLEMTEDQFLDLILQQEPCITIDYARFSDY
jgi:hypothetical protein